MNDTNPHLYKISLNLWYISLWLLHMFKAFTCLDWTAFVHFQLWRSLRYFRALHANKKLMQWLVGRILTAHSYFVRLTVIITPSGCFTCAPCLFGYILRQKFTTPSTPLKFKVWNFTTHFNLYGHLQVFSLIPLKGMHSLCNNMIIQLIGLFSLCS